MIKNSIKFLFITTISSLLFIGCSNHEAALKILPNEIAQANECISTNKELEADCYDLISYKNSIAMLRSGINAYTKGNYKEAFHKYTLAQKKGNFYANSLLADLYNKGNGVAKNQEIALELLKDVDDVDGIAAYKLSFYYINKKDYDEALELLIFAGNNNVKKAQYELSKIYRDGTLAKDDPIKAKSWYEKYENKSNSLIRKIYGI
ncbi:tetratricopeptide repeat protein [Poseidonibacter antarcticus]|uniref:tetratricopeptide repeat protein n=1 Tax=Poseidonibacter antarcticus TaxID=2478538 RepID=UPI000EF50B23|nr:sel1 repeat family protein [Poseidonibacter antarcticus]